MPNITNDNHLLPAAIMDAALADNLTEEGLYHGTVLYHMGPGETIDAAEFAAHRWGSKFLEAFGGLYVTFNYDHARMYAMNLRRDLLSHMGHIVASDASSVIYTISVHEGCAYALDEDYLGWELYLETGTIAFSERFYDYLPGEAVQEVNWEAEKINKTVPYGDKVPPDIAKVFYDDMSRVYASTVLEHGWAPIGQKPTFRLLNDQWSVLDVTEIL